MSRFLLLTLLVFLPGCFKVGPDYEKPVINSPVKWRFGVADAKATSNLEWWRLLGDPVLNQLIEKALRNNLDLKAAIARVEQFMGVYGSTRANLFPQISYGADYEYRKGSGTILNLPGVTTNPNQTHYADIQTSMMWELDVWGALRRANESALAEMLAQEYVKQGVMLTLVSNVALTYIQLLTLDKNLAITKGVVQSLFEQRKIELARFKNGYISELEVTQIESEYQRRLALIPEAEQEIAQTEHALKVLIGENPGPIRRDKTLDELLPPPVPKGLPTELLARRPDIRRAEQSLIAANARIGVARGQYFPKIALTGDVGQMSTQLGSLFTPGANFWSVGMAIVGPLFTAGKIAGQVASTEAVQRESLANYKKTIITAFKEFEDALIATQKTAEKQEKEGNRVGAVSNYYRLSKIRYDEGLTDYITVLDSVRQLFDAQIEQLQAQSANLAASIQLYKAMGGGWIPAKEMQMEITQPPLPGVVH